MKFLMLPLLMLCSVGVFSQKMTTAQMKAGIEKAANPVAYVREVLKKKYKIDTVAVMNTTQFQGIADSLAYKGQQGKVYGPYEKKYLVMILGRAPNSFNRISQIFIDTSTFRRRIADSLATSIVARIKSGSSSFEDMSQAYSMGGEGRSKGDLGWIARGSILPEIEKAIATHKKEGVWRKYTLTGDVIAIQTFKWGNQDGLSQYFNGLGELQREENWKALNPDKLYDTVVIEDIDKPEHYKKVVVKNEGAGIRHGHWTYYDPVTGFIVKEEDYMLGVLEGKKREPVTATAATEEKKVAKPKEVLDFEKKNAGRKKIRVRDGATGY